MIEGGVENWKAVIIPAIPMHISILKTHYLVYYNLLATLLTGSVQIKSCSTLELDFSESDMGENW